MTEPSAWARKQVMALPVGEDARPFYDLAMALDAAWRAGAEATRREDVFAIEKVASITKRPDVQHALAAMAAAVKVCALPAPGEDPAAHRVHPGGSGGVLPGGGGTE